MKREERKRDLRRYLYPTTLEFSARQNEGQESSESHTKGVEEEAYPMASRNWSGLTNEMGRFDLENSEIPIESADFPGIQIP